MLREMTLKSLLQLNTDSRLQGGKEAMSHELFLTISEPRDSLNSRLLFCSSVQALELYSQVIHFREFALLPMH